MKFCGARGLFHWERVEAKTNKKLKRETKRNVRVFCVVVSCSILSISAKKIGCGICNRATLKIARELGSLTASSFDCHRLLDLI